MKFKKKLNFIQTINDYCIEKKHDFIHLLPEQKTYIKRVCDGFLFINTYILMYKRPVGDRFDLHELVDTCFIFISCCLAQKTEFHTPFARTRKASITNPKLPIYLIDCMIDQTLINNQNILYSLLILSTY